MKYISQKRAVFFKMMNVRVLCIWLEFYSIKKCSINEHELVFYVFKK